MFGVIADNTSSKEETMTPLSVPQRSDSLRRQTFRWQP
jgi:hypothetical protein